MTFDQKSKEMDLPARLHKVLALCLLGLTKGPLLAGIWLYQRTLLFLDQIKREKGGSPRTAWRTKRGSTIP